MREVILDTNTLLNGINLSEYEKVFLPITILEELDNIKHKSEGELNYKARKSIKQIEEANNIEFVLEYNYTLPKWLNENVPDNRILGFAMDIYVDNPNSVLLSGDINVLAKARALGIPCEKYDGNKGSPDEIYKGYKVATMSDYEMSVHYQCPTNKFNLLNNEYLLIKNEKGITVDRQRWTEEKGFMSLNTKALKSIYFGDVKPKDDFQMMAIDSLNNADLTLLFGIAGSAKTLLSLAWMMQNIQNQKINKGVIIFNSVPLRNNQTLGFYPGDRNQKLLQSSLGGILSSKLGDMTMVETLINQGKLMIVPTSDIRGIEISDNDCLFVTEAQNTDAYTMRTILQRAKDKCKIIIEGDMLEQQDLRGISNKENGMSRIIDVFKGTKYFSCVKLKNTYRSPIAELAQNV